jgi:hypothetical protein
VVGQVVLGVLTGLLVAEIVVSIPMTDGQFGQDYVYYRDLGARWLADGSFYRPDQLIGPYDVTLMGDVLYPPPALLLFVPLSFLPAAVWWTIPIAVLAFVLVLWRPSVPGWIAVVLLLAWPRANAAFLFGNSDIWAMAGIAGGLRWGWPAVLLLLKPTFAPFMLIGAVRRSWWIALGALALVSLAMLPLWFDYVEAMQNLRVSIDYSVGGVPLLLVPVVAWMTRTRLRGPTNRSRPWDHRDGAGAHRRG